MYFLNIITFLRALPLVKVTIKDNAKLLNL